MDHRREHRIRSPLSVCWCDLLSIYHKWHDRNADNDVVEYLWVLEWICSVNCWTRKVQLKVSYRFDVDPSSHVNSRKMVVCTTDMYRIPPIRILLFALHSFPKIPARNLRRQKSTAALSLQRPMRRLYCCKRNDKNEKVNLGNVSRIGLKFTCVLEVHKLFLDDRQHPKRSPIDRTNRWTVAEDQPPSSVSVLWLCVLWMLSQTPLRPNRVEA